MNGNDPLVAHIIDARGKSCPQPIIEIAQVARGLGDAAQLVLLSDDLATAIDLPAWCRMKGHSFLGVIELPEPNHPGGQVIEGYLVQLGS